MSPTGTGKFGPWEFNGFGLLANDDIVLRPEGIYQKITINNTEGWKLKKTWAQLLE